MAQDRAGSPPLPREASSPQRLSGRREIARKLLHLSTAAAPLAYAGGLSWRTTLAVLVSCLTAAAIVELSRLRSARARAAFHSIANPLLRAHEHDGLAGATWLLLAFTCAVMVLPRPVAVAAMWAVSVGDAAAALVGRAIGRHIIGSGRKTIEGAAACAIATSAGALLVARLDPVGAVVAGVSAAAAEFPGRPLDDNLRIVIVVGAALLGWQALS